MMGQQETTMTVRQAGGALRRVILALAVATLMAVLTMAMVSEPAFAKGGCKGFGQAVNGAAHEEHPFGQELISGAAQNGSMAPVIHVVQDGHCN